MYNWRYFIPLFLWLSISWSGNSTASEKVISLRTAVFDGCPFICLDGSGAFLDILRLALKDTHYQLEFVELPYNRAKKSVANGSIDLLPGSLKNSIEGAFYPDSWMFFTQMCFFVNQNDDWIYNGFKSLRNRSLLVENGIIYTPEFFEHIKTLDNVQSISGEQILERQHKMLINKRIDTFLAEQTVLKHHMNDNPTPATVTPIKAGCFSPEYEFVAVSSHRQDAEAFTTLLTQKLKSIRQTEAFRELIH